jgi:hypothetical protein
MALVSDYRRICDMQHQSAELTDVTMASQIAVRLNGKLAHRIARRDVYDEIREMMIVEYDQRSAGKGGILRGIGALTARKLLTERGYDIAKLSNRTLARYLADARDEISTDSAYNGYEYLTYDAHSDVGLPIVPDYDEFAEGLILLYANAEIPFVEAKGICAVSPHAG